LEDATQRQADAEDTTDVQVAKASDSEDATQRKADAEQQLQSTQQHFDEMNQIYSECLEKEEVAKQLDVQLPPEDRKALESARQSVTVAKKALDEATIAFQEAEDYEEENRILSREDAAKRLEQVQENFAQVNQVFQEQMRIVNEAKANGEEVTQDTRDALEKANKDAARAHMKLDKAVAALSVAEKAEKEGKTATKEERTATTEASAAVDDTADASNEDIDSLTVVEADQKLHDAQEHFAEVDRLFNQKLQEADKVKKLGGDLTVEAKEALESAHQDAFNAQKDVDKAKSVFERIKEKEVDDGMSVDDAPPSQEDAVQQVQKAQDYFAEVKADFELKLKNVEEAKARGEEVSDAENEAVDQAHKKAVDAAHVLEKASSALNAASGAGAQESDVLSIEDAEQKVEQAQQHFARVNQDFEEKMHRMADARANGDDVTDGEREELAQANKDATLAHKQLDQAVAALSAAKEAPKDENVGSKHVDGPLDEEVFDEDLGESVLEDGLHEARLLAKETSRAYKVRLAKYEEGKTAGASAKALSKQKAVLDNFQKKASTAQKILDQLVQAKNSQTSIAVQRATKKWTTARQKSRKMAKLARHARKDLDKDS